VSSSKKVHYVVEEHDPKHFRVRKMTSNDGEDWKWESSYDVKDGICNCPQATYRKNQCKHLKLVAADFGHGPAVPLDRARDLTADQISYLSTLFDKVTTDVEPYERTPEGLICGIRLVGKTRVYEGPSFRMFLIVEGIPVTLRLEGR
jgi:hypothetical protein